MKIDPKAPAYPVIGAPGASEDFPGIPIRLAIAAQIMAGFPVGGRSDHHAEFSLARADALISAYNEGEQ